MNEKEVLITQLIDQSYRNDLILNSTHDGMIVIDNDSRITFLNNSAAKMIEVQKEDVIGAPIQQVIPTSKLPNVLRTRSTEVNQELILKNGKKIITTRIPMVNQSGILLGAFAVFKDITEVVNLAAEITNLKEVQTMLEAIIQSSDDAISVVDENGIGTLINPAYTRITGLTKDVVIGKPASADITEGDSMHMQVLKTRRAVRGVQLKVGPTKRDVVVNVAPIIVEGKLKGSVGVIHDMSEIRKLTSELSRARQIIRTLEAKYTFVDIIGTSEEMKVAVEQAKLGAKTPATVLLRGESGTGKELFAHAIHNGSDRKFNKFIRINCAAVSEAELENELFGCEETTISRAKQGLFEEANNGSIFLDEIGELSIGTQAKLLRVLQEREVLRVGGNIRIPINVRVIAATKVNLEKGIANGSFREDLYYLLNRMPIQIPPLRVRKKDIFLLSQHLIAKLNQEYGRSIEGLTKATSEYLADYDWPGNVRELENVLARAIIFMKSSEVFIDVTHIQSISNREKAKVENLVVSLDGELPLSDMVEKFEAKVIKQALQKFEGNKTLTAKSLGVSLRSLYYKLEKYNLANQDSN